MPVRLGTLQEIREWQAAEKAAGRPWRLRDYFEARGICCYCWGKGMVAVLGKQGDTPCTVCSGSGARQEG